MEKRRKSVLPWILGAVIGFLNGFFGGGGGMICVPVLSRVLKLPQKNAHATALAVILPLSVVSAAFYFVGNNLTFSSVAVTGLGVFLGGLAGALLLKKLPSRTVRVLFALLMAAAGVKLMF